MLEQDFRLADEKFPSTPEVTSMKPALRARPSVRDKVDFFNDHAHRAASSSRERPARTPTRQTSEELMNRTPPLTYAASSTQASSEFDRNLRYDSEDESSDLRSVPSFPSLPSGARKASEGEPLPPLPSTAPPPIPTTITTTVSNISPIQTTSSPINQPSMSPVAKSPPPRAIEEEDEDSPPLHLDRPQGLLLVANTSKGRAVKAARAIPNRTVIEVCPVLVLDPMEVQNHFQHTFLHNYTYNWPWKDQRLGRTIQTQALPLGLGSLFNHSNHLWKSNVGWTRNVSGQGHETATVNGAAALSPNGSAFGTFDSYGPSNSDGTSKDRRQVAGNDSITYTALRDIEAGEELCISYGPADRLTFVDVEAEQEALEAAMRERAERDDGDASFSRASSSVHDAPMMRQQPTGPISPLENLWVDVDAIDIYSRIDEEHGVR